jgi:periplasmic protein CpxP/Spy
MLPPSLRQEHTMKTHLAPFAAAAFAMALFAVPALTAPRQAPAAAPSEGAAKLKAISAQLNLTPEQKVRLLPVLEQEAPKLKAVKENTSLPPMQKLQQIRAIHAESDPKIKSILTPDQYTKWEEMRKQEIQEMIAKRRAQNQ